MDRIICENVFSLAFYGMSPFSNHTLWLMSNVQWPLPFQMPTTDFDLMHHYFGRYPSYCSIDRARWMRNPEINADEKEPMAHDLHEVVIRWKNTRYGGFDWVLFQNKWRYTLMSEASLWNGSLFCKVWGENIVFFVPLPNIIGHYLKLTGIFWIRSGKYSYKDFERKR